MTSANPLPKPTSYGILLYNNFAPLDVFGTFEYLVSLPADLGIKVHLIGATLDPIASSSLTSNMPALASKTGELVVPQYTFDTHPPLDVLIVPGGVGVYDLVDDPKYSGFIASQYPKLQYLYSVCTGAPFLAKSGVLDGRNATTNKADFAWVESQGPNVRWIKKARWVVDGNIWTSSGVEAGTDMANAFIGHVYGVDVAKSVSQAMEYLPQLDSTVDLFADLYNLTTPADRAIDATPSLDAFGGLPSAHTANTNTPQSIGVLLADGYNVLDVFGTLDFFHALSFFIPFRNISVIAKSLEPVLSHGGQATIPTHTIDTPPTDLEVLIVPGRADTLPWADQSALASFIGRVYPKLRYLITISSGSILVASAPGHILRGKDATTSELAWPLIHTLPSDAANWVREARWAVTPDGKVWTAGGSGAGLDVGYAFVSTVWGAGLASQVSKVLEYTPHPNASWDPWSEGK